MSRTGYEKIGGKYYKKKGNIQVNEMVAKIFFQICKKCNKPIDKDEKGCGQMSQWLRCYLPNWKMIDRRPCTDPLNSPK